MPVGRPSKHYVIKKHWPNDFLPFVQCDFSKYSAKTKQLEDVEFISTPYEKWTKNPDGGWDIQRIVEVID